MPNGMSTQQRDADDGDDEQHHDDHQKRNEEELREQADRSRLDRFSQRPPAEAIDVVAGEEHDESAEKGKDAHADESRDERKR